LIHSRLSHPHIIKMLDSCETATEYILYEEYAGHGCDYLANKIKQQQFVNPTKLKKWSHQIIDALNYLHNECGVIH